MYADNSQAQSYFELAGLNRLRRLSRENNSPEAIKAVAAEFESMFLHMMLKSMRQTSFGDPLFDSDATQSYRDMYDQQLAVDMARQGGIGLADMLVQQLSGPYAGVTMRHYPDRPATELPLDASRIHPARHCHSCEPDAVASSSSTSVTSGEDHARSEAEDNAITEPAQQSSSGERQGQMTNGTVAYAETVMAALRRKSARVSTDDADAQKVHSIARGNPEKFVSTLWPMAQKAAHALGVDARVLLAQAALETGWGRAVVHAADGTSSHNLFNIKADGRWDGDRVSVTTLEYRDGVAAKERHAFRAYESFEESFNDYVEFLKTSPRYHKALAHAFDSNAFVRELQQAGYATDPQYAEKINRIMNGEPITAMADAAISGAGEFDLIGG